MVSYIDKIYDGWCKTKIEQFRNIFVGINDFICLRKFSLISGDHAK